MRHLTAFAVLLTLSGPVTAESLSEKTGVNTMLGVAPSTQDFVTQAANGGLFEVESSKLATERASDKVKAFAKQMIADHEKVNGELKAMVQGGKAKAELPAALDSSHQSKLDKLKGLQGKDFTDQYVDDQVKAHKDAVDLFKRYGDEGENAELKTWAAKTRPNLEAHLKIVQELDNEPAEKDAKR